MRKLIRTHPVAAYFALACALSWIVWFPLVAKAQGLHVGTFAYQHFLGAFGPLLAAAVVTATVEGGAGIPQLARRMIRWRVDVRWILTAVFGPVAIYLISAVGVGIYSGVWPDFAQFGQSDEFPGLGLAAVYAIHTLTFGFGEEAGWRGFALPRLQTHRSAFTATIILTVFWACWHIPTFFYRPGYSSMGVGEIVGWFFSLLTGAILLTWLYNSTNGSILIVALFHGSVDVAFTSKLIEVGTMNTMGALIVVWAIIVVLHLGPSNLSRCRRQQAEPDGQSQSADEVLRYAE